MLKRHAPEALRDVPETYRGIYCHATEIADPGRMLFLSGQIGVNRQGQTLPGFKGQVHQAMDNVERLLEASGMSAEDILRVVYYVTDPDHLPQLTEIRQGRWNSDKAPAVTTLVVAGLAAADLLVEIEVTAGR